MATKDAAPLSKATLEFCDELIDGITLAANHPDLAKVAQTIATAKAEIAEALKAAGGKPVSTQRKE